VRTRIALPALLAICALLLAACGGKTVSKDEVAKQLQSAFAKRGFTAPVKSVECPKDLDAKAGKTEFCTLTYRSGHALQVKASVTGVSGGKAQLTYVVTKRLK
jgi:hypothetical protein